MGFLGLGEVLPLFATVADSTISLPTSLDRFFLSHGGIEVFLHA